MDTVRTLRSADDGEPLILVCTDEDSDCIHMILHKGMIDVITADTDGSFEYLIHLDNRSANSLSLALADAYHDVLNQKEMEEHTWL